MLFNLSSPAKLTAFLPLLPLGVSPFADLLLLWSLDLMQGINVRITQHNTVLVFMMANRKRLILAAFEFTKVICPTWSIMDVYPAMAAQRALVMCCG